MKLIDKIFYIMLDDYYYCGKDESPTIKGLGTGALTGVNSVPIFNKDKSKAKPVNNVLSLRTVVTEIIDAVRYEDIFKNKTIKELKIIFEEEEEWNNKEEIQTDIYQKNIT